MDATGRAGCTWDKNGRRPRNLVKKECTGTKVEACVHLRTESAVRGSVVEHPVFHARSIYGTGVASLDVCTVHLWGK